MSIFGVQSSSQTGSVQSLASLLQSAQSDGGTAASGSAGSVSGAASTDISKPGKLFSRLQSLAESDPAKFKAVTADFAAKLNALAQQTGGAQGQRLSQLAAKFTQASQTGDASGLKPKGHRHHHSGGGSGASAASDAYSQNATDPFSAALSAGSSSASGGSSSGAGSRNPAAALFQQLSQQLSQQPAGGQASA